ncbi:hypothetical protein [Armatimonas rosea]|uniref:Uncharacterized protein n=1 Tax=Armatimonas rosea TaxID=685828 RepID=A0A7W9SLL6_ARMRO|nr:hypothetical protein [Armatimonas rosea]MBB6048896.1 hypothetical protein [Armatimonas rosea]
MKSHAGGNRKFDERAPEVNKDRQAAGVNPNFDETKNPLRLVTPIATKKPLPIRRINPS